MLSSNLTGVTIWGGGEDGESRRTVNPLPAGSESSNLSLPTTCGLLVKQDKTPGFQSGDEGSSPSEVTNKKQALRHRAECLFCFIQRQKISVQNREMPAPESPYTEKLPASRGTPQAY